MKTKFILRAALAALLAGCGDQRSLPTELQSMPRFTTYNATVAAPFALSGDNGWSSSRAVAINDLGTIAGLRFPFALKWVTGTDAVPASLSPTVIAPGDAKDINDAGQVVGSSVVSFVDAATLWTPNGDGTYTATLVGLPGAYDSFASAINAKGQVVGTARVWAGSVLIQKCFLWTPTSDNGMTGSAQEIVRPGGGDCVLHDINSDGQAVGAGTTAGSNVSQAFVYDAGVTTALLPENSIATAINDGGQIVGLQAGNGVIWNPVAGGWTAATALGVPPLAGQSGVIQSLPLDINNAGFVVGSARDDASVYRAFIWNSGAVTELTGGDSPFITANALTNVVNNRIIVAGVKVNTTTSEENGLRWTVSLTPIVTEGCNDKLVRLIGELKSAGALTAGVASSLLSKVDAASRQAAAGKTTAAKNILDALSAEINALQTSRKLTATQADSLRAPIACML